MASIPLLTADASEILLGALLQPTWGIYYSGTNGVTGQPVIQPASFIQSAFVSQVQPLTSIANLVGLSGILPVSASTLEFEYRQDWPVSTYPQEQGAFQAYDKVTLPFDIRMRLAAGGSPSTRKAFIETCLTIANATTQLFNILTPEMPFIGVTCNHIDFKRTPTHGNTLVIVDMAFIQVPLISSNVGTNTQAPGDSAKQALGNLTPPNLSLAQTAVYKSLSPPVL